jgi:hypothetical protein
MAHAAMADPNKRGIFDRLKDAASQILPGADAPKQGAGTPARRPASAAGPDGFSRTGGINRAGATGGLGAPPSTGRLEAEAPKGPPDVVLSPRRLQMIEDYMAGEYRIESMKDPAFMYKIVSDERAYQTRLLFEYRKQLQGLPTASKKAEEIQKKIERAQTITTNLFKVLKRITGAEGSTGGTDFLSDKK